MIEESISKLAFGFFSFWNKILEKHPRFHLDFTFPSVGNLDLFLQHLIRKEEYNAKDLSHIQGAAAYLGMIAYKCWLTFSPAAEVKLSLLVDEIILSIKGGDFQKENEISQINISKNLKNVLQNPENPFPFFSKVKRNLMPKPKLISMFALGLFFGLSPYVEGKLKEIEEQDFLKKIKVVLYHLSVSCAEYYQRLFPTEKLGAKAALYHNFLILPPLGQNEKPYLSRNTHQLNLYLSKLQVTKEEKIQLLFNLSIFPNELISYVSFSLLTAYHEQPLPNRLKLLSESYREAAFSLFDNINYINKLLNENFSLTTMGTTFSSLGLAPLMLLNPKDYIAMNEDSLLTNLIYSNSQECIGYLNSIADKNSFMRMQLIYILIKEENYLNIEKYLDHKKSYQDNTLENIYYYLNSLFLLETNKASPEEILEELNKVQLPFEANNNLITEIIELKVYLLCKLAQYQQAYDFLSNYLETKYFSLRLSYFYLEICSKLDLEEERNSLLEKMKRYVPYDNDLILCLMAKSI